MFISNKSETISCRRLETKRHSVRNGDFGFRRKAQVRSNTLFIFIKSVPMQRRHLRREYVSFRHVRNQNPTKAGIPLCRCRHISPLRFLHALKRQALIFSLPSHPHQARFYRCALICFIVSFIWLCLTPFTAAPLICGLAFTYRVSAVSFASLCGVSLLIYLHTFL